MFETTNHHQPVEQRQRNCQFLLLRANQHQNQDLAKTKLFISQPGDEDCEWLVFRRCYQRWSCCCLKVINLILTIELQWDLCSMPRASSMLAKLTSIDGYWIGIDILLIWLLSMVINIYGYYLWIYAYTIVTTTAYYPKIESSESELFTKRRRVKDLFELQPQMFRHPVLRREPWMVPWVTGSMWKNSAINLKLVLTLFNLWRCFKYSLKISHICSEWSELWTIENPYIKYY